MRSNKTRTFYLRYSGDFDFQGLYDYLCNFFVSRNYDLFETRWKEKEGSPEGREITVNMKPDKKINEYVKYVYKLEWKSVDAHPVQITQNGQKKQGMNARFHIIISADVQVDWQNLEKNRLMDKALAKLYNEYLFKREFDQVYAGPLEEEIQQIMDGAKKILHMELA